MSKPYRCLVGLTQPWPPAIDRQHQNIPFNNPGTVCRTLWQRSHFFSLSLCLILTLPVSMKFSLSVFKNAHLFQSFIPWCVLILGGNKEGVFPSAFLTFCPIIEVCVCAVNSRTPNSILKICCFSLQHELANDYSGIKEANTVLGKEKDLLEGRGSHEKKKKFYKLIFMCIYICKHTHLHTSIWMHLSYIGRDNQIYTNFDYTFRHRHIHLRNIWFHLQHNGLWHVNFHFKYMIGHIDCNYSKRNIVAN